MVEVRSFARRDREQLTRLVNAHVATAVPGASVPSATLLSQLEHPLGEYVVGPWVVELTTFVGVERDRIVAPAHLRRYGDDDRVSDGYRSSGEIVWLVFWPNDLEAGRAVRDAALSHLAGWGCHVWHADGTLPAPGCFGVADSWPHVQLLYQEAGFDADGGQVEVVYAGSLEVVPPPGAPPVVGLGLVRQVGPWEPRSTPFWTVRSSGPTRWTQTSREAGRTWPSRVGPMSATTWVREDLRGQGIGTWLFAHSVAWLRLGGLSRLLAYGIEDGHIERTTRYYARLGLSPISRTVRGWRRDGHSAGIQ